jgi:hypothetical protein
MAGGKEREREREREFHVSRFPFCKSWKNSFAVVLASSFLLLETKIIIA